MFLLGKLSTLIILAKTNYYRIIALSYLVVLSFFYTGKNVWQIASFNIENNKIDNQTESIKIVPSLYPKINKIRQDPLLTAKSAILIEMPSAVVLYKKNENLKLAPASTTKIMTALVSLKNYDLQQVIDIRYVEKTGAQMGLEIGDKVSIKNLLYGLLINSGNDAATILSANYPGGTRNFVKEMNNLAKQWHLYETNFTNPTGLYEDNHYATVRDLARLGVIGKNYPLFANIVSLKNYDAKDITNTKTYKLENVNKLIGAVQGINGIKTGWTEEAGECLVASAERNGKKLISVILGSQDRFAETRKLIDWGYDNTIWQKINTKVSY